VDITDLGDDEPRDEPPVAPPPVVPPSGLVLAVAVAEALRRTSAESIEAIPASFYSSIRRQGFDSLFLLDVPEGADFALVQSTAEAEGLTVVGCPTIDESATEPIALPPDPITGLQYTYDPTLVQTLRASHWQEFLAILEGPNADFNRLVHFATRPFNLSAGLLLLPGLRVIRPAEDRRSAALLRLLLRPSVRVGDFSIPESTRSFGEMATWKYASQNDRVLVCFNFVDSHAVADIVCPDAPDAVRDDLIDVVEMLSETIYRRDPEEMRTKGLHVILHEYELQIFTY
jgi:hypothetical protein